MTTYVSALVDEKQGVDRALVDLYDRIKLKSFVPIGNPVFIKSGEKTNAYFDSEGEPVTEIYGVITQACEKNPEESFEVGYIARIYNANFSVIDGIKSIEKELEKKKVIPVGTIIDIPSCEKTIIGTEHKDKIICGCLVQVYKISKQERLKRTLKKAFD